MKLTNFLVLSHSFKKKVISMVEKLKVFIKLQKEKKIILKK